MSEGEKIIVQNRKARHDYHVLDKIEAGIALQGTEVKSLREGGNIVLKDSFADIRDDEVWLIGVHIQPYKMGNVFNHDVERKRKLLLHRQEINKLRGRIAEKGLTLVPLKLYFTRGIVKVQIGVCKGKQKADKRETLKAREAAREMDRAVKSARKGD
jgi:SsrA-binding protein